MLVLSTFTFSGKCGLNSGIITSIFSTCIVYTSVIFYLKHAQKLTVTDFIGMLLIIGCILFISLSPSESQAIEVEGAEEYKVLAILFANFCGLAFTLLTFELNWSSKTGLPTMQQNFDSGFILGLCVLPFYLAQDKSIYDLEIYIVSNVIFILIILAIVSMNYAVKYGNAGRAQALDQMKSIWQVLLTVIIDSSVPTGMEIAGCASGIIGTILIILSRDK